jgi:hypothetical protein
MAIFYQDAVGAQQWKKVIPLFGNATDIKRGAFVKWGPTDGTNRGFGIPCPVNTALAGNFLGITEALFAAGTLDNDPSAGTKYLLTDCTINPHGIYLTQYDNALTSSRWTNGLAVTGVGATTVVTSGENIAGGWLFFDNFELHYVLSCSSGTYTTKTATSSAITTANKVAKIFYPGELKLSFTGDFTQIGINQAAQGSVEMSVLDNFIKAQGYDFISLDPTKHDNIILPSAAFTPQIWATIQSTQHFLL